MVGLDFCLVLLIAYSHMVPVVSKSRSRPPTAGDVQDTTHGQNPPTLCIVGFDIQPEDKVCGVL